MATNESQHLKIPFLQIQIATENFKFRNGTGGYGFVYKGVLRVSGKDTDVAVKRLNEQLGQGLKEFSTEIELLSRHKHPNLISLIGYCDEGNEKIIVYEYAERGSLDKYLKRNATCARLTWLERLKVCVDAARGLEYLHNDIEGPLTIIHRDIKSSNILIDENGVAKISDLGLSKLTATGLGMSRIISNGVGTRGYCEPEYYHFGKVTIKSDVYSFGIVLFEVLCGRLCLSKCDDGFILSGESVKEYKNKNLVKIVDPSIKYHFGSDSMTKFAAIAYKCLHDNRKIRPTMDVVRKELEETLKFQKKLITKYPHLYSDNFLKDFCIPDYILFPGGNIEVPSDAPACPTLVFINSKSGVQLGGELLLTCRSLLNPSQVFDLGEDAPDKVLHRFYLTLENHSLNGDTLANTIKQRLRIIVAGGDGTANWLLGVVSDMKLSHPPLIATMPLGKENSLPFALGWGRKNPGTDRESVLIFLKQLVEGKEMAVDSWHMLLRMKAPNEGPGDLIAPLELPHSLHAFNPLSDTDSRYNTFRGGFWNDFSMGVDARASYLLKLHHIQSTSGVAGALLGLTAASYFESSSKNIGRQVKVKIMQRLGRWEDLTIEPSIKSILCLNLPSLPEFLKLGKILPPMVDDGLLEIIGIRYTWYYALISPSLQIFSLAKAHRVRFEFHKGAADCTYMSMDGESWKQPLPVDNDTTFLELSHPGRVKMLATQNCKSESVQYDPSNSYSVDQHKADDWEDEDATLLGEEWRMFGAADALREPGTMDVKPGAMVPAQAFERRTISCPAPWSSAGIKASPFSFFVFLCCICVLVGYMCTMASHLYQWIRHKL